MRDKELEELKEQKKKRKRKVTVAADDGAIEDEDVGSKITKMENQKREFEKKLNKKIQQQKPKEVAYYPNKRHQRAEDLLNKFKELKESGRLEKYLDKRRKKESAKSRKKMKIEK